ncbi:TonB-dependent receptor [Flavobacterium sp. MAH-1]|uniref:TonB-dependent receptor n=1 Tax=Flavobacterium agri TaxID=2743471 RepID=A0A7Y9C6A0_9FLAO|nr:outer membrane beta-barrel protein [Flavobacterium agri]NUY81811.1 TonB-dependent receptor [Flavobacterium agri]NYA71835.1 TonB-dependent receptor [Flavobacterium agri]
MPKLYLSVLALLVGLGCFAQNSVTIKGKILEDKTQIPLEAVTVYIASAKDSTVIDYTVTDKSGAFSFTSRKTDKPVVFKVSFIGFKSIEKTYDKGLSTNLDFGVMRMEESEMMLGEVTVKNEAPPIRIKNDTLEFNASSFKIRPDANVETLLKQLPGVEIDNEGKITVNGKEVSQILVNGKPFFDKEGKVALQNLPSDIINKVQITDAKTKKEELSGEKASSNNASINLTIDEEKNKGFFGKINGGYGTDDRYESSLMLNYFNNKRKISLLASANNINSTGFTMNEIFDSMGGGRNYSVWTNDNGSFGINNMQFGGGNGITTSQLVGLNYGDELIKDFSSNGSYFYNAARTENTNRTREKTLLNSGSFTTDSNSKTVDDRIGHNVNLDLEYKIDSLTTVNFAPRFVKGHSYNENKGGSVTTEENGRISRESSRDNFSNSDNQSLGGNLYINRAFKRKGRFVSLWLESEFTKSDAENRNLSQNTFYRDTDEDGVTDAIDNDDRNQKRLDRNLSDRFQGGIDFTEPLKDSINIKIGIDFSKEQNIGNRHTYDFDATTDSYSLLNDSITNYLRSATRKIAPQAGFSINKKKLNLQANFGTAVYLFEANSDYLGDKVSISQEKIYPTGNLWGGFNFTKSMNLWVNYSFNVDFPSAAQVLPVTDVSDPLNTRTGNPALSPNKSHYTYISFRDYDYATKSGWSIYGGGNFFESQVVGSTTYDSSRKSTTEYVNVSGNSSLWFGGNWSRTIKHEAHSYRFGFGLNGGYNRNQGFLEGELYDAKSTRLSPRVMFNYDYGELLSVAPRYELTYNETNYTNFSTDKQTNVTHKFTLQTTSYWPKHVVFGNDFSYTYNSNIADGFKKDFYLWNASLGYNFLSDHLLFKVKVYDVLNQNQNTTRSISATYIRDEENVVLKRYAMFSLTYKLDKFAGKKKEGGRRFWMFD